MNFNANLPFIFPGMFTKYQQNIEYISEFDNIIKESIILDTPIVCIKSVSVIKMLICSSASSTLILVRGFRPITQVVVWRQTRGELSKR